MQKERAKAKTRIEIFDDEEESKQTQTTRKVLNFDDVKSSVKSKMKTFDLDVMRDH